MGEGGEGKRCWGELGQRVVLLKNDAGRWITPCGALGPEPSGIAPLYLMGLSDDCLGYQLSIHCKGTHRWRDEAHHLLLAAELCVMGTLCLTSLRRYLSVA